MSRNRHNYSPRREKDEEEDGNRAYRSSERQTDNIKPKYNNRNRNDHPRSGGYQNRSDRNEWRRDDVDGKDERITEEFSNLSVSRQSNRENRNYREDRSSTRRDYHQNAKVAPKKTEIVKSQEEDEDTTIVGTSTKHEKSYLRLTSRPNPADVRPEKVLREWLPLLLSQYEKNHNYEYVCDQLKSIRQDITVQNIRNDLSVSVYMTHLKLALLNNDLSEFSVCLSMLEGLARDYPFEGYQHVASYRILYSLAQEDVMTLHDCLHYFTSELLNHESIKHAVSVMLALTCYCNYKKFFELHSEVPTEIGELIMNWLGKTKVRKQALSVIVKSYRPTLAVEFVERELGFISYQECLDYLKAEGVILNAEETLIMCKETTIK